MDDVRNALRSSEVFAGLPESTLELLAPAATRRELAAGSPLFRQGTPRRAVYLVTDGHVELFREQAGAVNRLVLLGPGETVGVGALLHTSDHTTSARAVSRVSLWELPREAVRDRLREDSEAAMDVLSRVALVMSRHLQYQSPRAVGREKAYGSGATRREHDLLGDRDVPADALYGIQTLRAVENFPITGIPLAHFPALVRALAMVKLAAARANARLGVLPAPIAAAIEQAAREVIDGHHHGHFVVDMVQGGAGTSTNMNANEVIANRALEILGRPRGDYAACHPNNHVNLSQSTNDVYPTAIRIAAVLSLRALLSALEKLRAALAEKGERVPRRPEDGAHAAAGRGPDDARPGVRRLRRHDRGGRRAASRDGAAPAGGEHGRDGDRHRDQRRPALPAARRGGPAARHGARRPPRREPRRGDPRHGRVRHVLGRPQARRREALEDLQRPAAPLVGAALRAGRDQPPADAARARASCPGRSTR